jgi:hypothetical protein
MGGDSWDTWNVPMRDLLMKSQDNGLDKKRPHQRGSWSTASDLHGPQGGRIMMTSLSLLSLEVYYRHLPLYRRGLASGKDK